MALVVAVPLAWVATIPLSQFGGGLISGAIWLAIGYLLYVGELERREPVPAIA
jgi:Flp pilus assembly protein protease CpaA